MSTVLALSGLVSVSAANAATTTTSTTSNSTKTVMVCLKNPLDDLSVIQAGGSIKRKHAYVPIETVTLSAQAADRLKSNPNVTCVEDDMPVKATGQVQDWGITSVKAPSAWTSSYTGKGVKVGVIDTGVATHEDLVVSGGASFVSYTTSYKDDQGHGTHVAGIIGAKNNTLGTVGVAPDASLYAIKVLDNNGSGNLSDVVSGIDWAIANGMNIINMSMGAPSGTTSLQSAVDRAYASGILVFTAAGNSGNTLGTGNTVEFPAQYNSAIAVAAVDSASQRASFSSTGPKVELAAPGVNILSTYLNNQYATMSGTSMATPYAAGVAALWKQAYPSLSVADLRLKLQQTAKDLGTAGRDTSYGFGLIQAPAGSVATPTPVPTATPKPTATPAPTASPTPAPTAKSTTIVPTITQKYDLYFRGERVDINTKSTVNNVGIAGATVNLTLEITGYSKLTATTVTDANGLSNFIFTTGFTTPPGKYTLTLTVSKSGYTSGTTTKVFYLY